jgi:hypothetical protein
MAKKAVADAAKAKAAKQKKMIIGLAVVFLLAAAYAYNTMSGMGGTPASKPQAATTTASTSTTPAPSTPAPVVAAPVSTPDPSASGSTSDPTAGTAIAGGTQLIAAVKPSADTGQLQSFSRFASKDPFDSLGPQSSSSSSSGSSSSGGSSGSSGSGSSGGKGSKGGTTPATPPTPPAPPPTSAVLSVNGVEESVATGADFPASSATPYFQLVSLTATTAQVAIAGGSYATGQATLTLSVNKPTTLVNTADGTRYTLVLFPQGTQAPSGAASSSSGSSGSSSSSTPTSTTPVSTPTTTTTPGP